jgi:hypothetical protein
MTTYLACIFRVPQQAAPLSCQTLDALSKLVQCGIFLQPISLMAPAYSEPIAQCVDNAVGSTVSTEYVVCALSSSPWEADVSRWNQRALSLAPEERVDHLRTLCDAIGQVAGVFGVSEFVLVVSVGISIKEDYDALDVELGDLAEILAATFSEEGLCLPSLLLNVTI